MLQLRGMSPPEWLDSIGFDDPRYVVHSFRHGFKDRLRAAGVPEDVQRALMGHSDGSVASGYGSGFPLSVLREAVSKVTY